ncbi:cis-prenyltransferase [Coemansia nantahalensis]|uniref:Cis-prenyltransferase n=2 Tax=Coemansia TaxID=4863 RepID=A0ACC1L3A2_9FUNG|nr:cis-prenyltransferase [Coemansia nantahalensis]KAJ2769883.1 cis-prenyltransferase [Coemansia nantahalensis]KAJ2799966.1 cis-prenyltransferase [Coemansia helicoidea]
MSGLAQLSQVLAALVLVAAGYVVAVGSGSAASWPLPLQQQCKRAVDRGAKAVRNAAVRVVRQGQIPAHIAFIMDGNRRYARRLQQQASMGHTFGFHRLESVLEWCNELGIAHVSVFAFAINNFDRAAEEVAALMALAKDKLQELAEKSDLVRQHGVRICVIGNRRLLAEDVRRVVEAAEQATRGNTGMRLNVCFSYAATDEIAAAVRRVVEDVEAGRLPEDKVDEQALERRLLIPGPPLDILVRTSGQIRFSNFMLWQTAKMAYIRFVDVLWPEFSFFQMFCILVSWQLAHSRIQQRKCA